MISLLFYSLKKKKSYFVFCYVYMRIVFVILNSLFFFFCRNNSSIDQKFIFTIIKKFFFFPFFFLFSHCSSISSSVRTLGDYLLSMFFLLFVQVSTSFSFNIWQSLIDWNMQHSNICCEIFDFLSTPRKIYKSKLGSMTCVLFAIYYY
jgi:hypothetical protein